MAFKVTIGQFYNTKSIIHKLDPRIKILVSFAFMVLVFFADSIVLNVYIALALLALIYLSKVPLKVVLKAICPVFFFLVLAGLMNLFFVQGGNVLANLGPITISEAGLNAFFIYTFRFLFLVVAGTLVALTTNPIQLTDALESMLSPLQKLGLPAHELAMMLSIALRFIPTFSKEAERIIKAQSSRGADFESGNLIERVKLFIPIIVPLFASSMRHADNLANAMDARCYTGGEGRTHYRELAIDKRDITALIICAIYLLVFIALKIYL